MTNKYILLALSLVGVIVAWGTGLDWTSYVSPATALKIVGGLSSVSFVLKLFLPGPGQTAVPTGGALITHKSVTEPGA